MMYSPKELLHDGKAIKIYATEEANQIIVDFTDEITAFYKTKRAIIQNKGKCCCSISSMIFDFLNYSNVKTHFIKQLTETQMLCYRTKSIPLEVIVRNTIAGSLAERLDLEVGQSLQQPIFDLCYKSERLANPLINDYHALALGIVSEEVLAKIYELAKQINQLLEPLFKKAGILLIDYKLEFAFSSEGEIILRDYINPDNARFWDLETRASLDKDRFRQDKGNVGKAYNTIAERLKLISSKL